MSQQSTQTDDLRISKVRPLIAPAILMDELPQSPEGASLVSKARNDATQILQGKDDRLLVVVGPCSIHDPQAAIEYATKLKPLAEELSNDLLVVMRVYFEKPRTTVGWKGLINDPNLNDSFDINEGLRVARRLLLDISDNLKMSNQNEEWKKFFNENKAPANLETDTDTLKLFCESRKDQGVVLITSGIK